MKTRSVCSQAQRCFHCCCDRFVAADKSGDVRVMIGEEMPLKHAYLRSIMNTESDRRQLLA